MSADFPYGLELEPTPIPPVETLSQANEVLRTPAFSPDVSQGDEWRCFVLEGGVCVRVGLLVDFGVWCFCL